MCSLCDYAFVCAPMADASLLTAENNKETETTALSYLVNIELPSGRDGLQELVANLATASAGGSRYGDV